MKKTAKKKRARRATSGVAPIRFDTSDRKRLGWLQDDLGGLTLAGAVKWAVKDAYDRRKALQKVGRMSQELRRDIGVESVGYREFLKPPSPADTLQSDIRQRVDEHVSNVSRDVSRLFSENQAESKGSDK